MMSSQAPNECVKSIRFDSCIDITNVLFFLILHSNRLLFMVVLSRYFRYGTLNITHVDISKKNDELETNELRTLMSLTT